MHVKEVEVLYMRRIWPVIIVLTLWVTGCGPAFISEGNIGEHKYVVARVDTLYSLRMPELYEALVHSKLLPNGGTLSSNQVKAFLDSILCDTLAGFEADRLDLSEHYDSYRIYKQRYHRLLTTRYLDEVVYKTIILDSQEVVDFYNRRPDLFAVEEQVLLHQILISPLGLKNGPDSLHCRSLTPEQLEKETAEYAQQIRRLLDFGEPFSEVAHKYSHDTYSQDRDGLVGWTKRGVYLDPFDSIAFAMEPGDISQLYHDKSGWHILYVEDHIAEGVPSLDEQQYGTAMMSLKQDKANKIGVPLRDSLLAQIHLVFNEELLDTNVYLVDKPTWAAIVNGQDTIEFYDMWTFENAYRKKYDVDNTTPEMKKAMLHTFAGRYAFVQAARTTGIDTLPDVVAGEAALRHKYSKAIISEGRREALWNPPDSLIEKYYNEHVSEYKAEKPLRIQHIIVDDSVFGEFVRDQALSGVDFIELAKEYYPGEPSIRADLANLGEIGPKDVPPELYNVALTTPVGGISHPVKTQYGYHIVKVLSQATSMSVDQVRYKIIPILRKEHAHQVFNKYRNELYAHFNVRFPHRIYPVHLRPLTDRPK